MNTSSSQAGQALLLVLITLAAIVTIVLSVVSRSVTDIRTTAKEEEATRAFSAAEAGVEKALISTLNTTTLSDSGELENASFTAQVSNYAQGQTSFVHPRDILSADSGSIWFVSHNTSGNLVCNSPTLPCFAGNQIRICWGNSATINAQTPALEISVVYDPDANGNFSNASIARAVYDPNPSRRSSNSFAASGGNCTIAGRTFPFSATVNFGSIGIPGASYNSQNGLQMANVKFLYNTTTASSFGVDVSASGGILPGQGRRVESTGRSGESARRVEVYTLYPDVPVIFQSAIFTPGGLVK